MSEPLGIPRADTALTVLGEPDYLFGAGQVRIHIDHVDRTRSVRHDNDTWYEVTGTEYSPSGHNRGPRTMHVRARRLPPPTG